MRTFTFLLLLLCLPSAGSIDQHSLIAQIADKEPEDILEFIGTATYDICLIGEIVFPPGAPVFIVVGALGLLVKDIVQFSKPNPIDVAFKQLSEKLNQVTAILRTDIAGLGALFVEHSFTVDIIIKADHMYSLMQDLIAEPTRGIKKLFDDQFDRTPPLLLIMEVERRLNYDSTNPLIWAMKADPMKTEATFKHWKSLIHNLLYRLVFIQMFQIGSNSTNMNQVDRTYAHFNYTIVKTISAVEKFIDNYKIEYWPDVARTTIYEAQDNYFYMDHATRADYLKNQLARIYTKDEFYVIVYDAVGGYETHFYSSHPAFTIASARRGTCNIIVYRSEWRHKLGNNSIALIQIKQTVERFKLTIKMHPQKGLILAHKDLRDVLPINFWAIIVHPSVVIRSTGPMERGPGWWAEGMVSTNVREVFGSATKIDTSFIIGGV